MHPPTPGSPSQANFDDLFQESLQEELRQGASPRGAAGATAPESASGDEASPAERLQNGSTNVKRKGELSRCGVFADSGCIPLAGRSGKSADCGTCHLNIVLYSSLQG